jgi:hypothetical protein
MGPTEDSGGALKEQLIPNEKLHIIEPTGQ